MKRRLREPPSASSSGESRSAAPQPARRALGGRMVLAAVFVVLAIAAVWLIRTWRHAPGARDPETLRLAHLSQAAAYDSAVALGRAGHHEASLPYYRRALAGRGDLTWAAHFNYASALYNVGLEVRDLHGVATPATRSSIERVTLVRAALAQLDTAEMLATTPRERATVIRARGERLEIWGLPWDAFLQLRKAEWADSTNPGMRQAAEAYLMVLRYPEQRWAPGTTRPGLPASAMPAAGDSTRP